MASTRLIIQVLRKVFKYSSRQSQVFRLQQGPPRMHCIQNRAFEDVNQIALCDCMYALHRLSGEAVFRRQILRNRLH